MNKSKIINQQNVSFPLSCRFAVSFAQNRTFFVFVSGLEWPMVFNIVENKRFVWVVKAKQQTLLPISIGDSSLATSEMSNFEWNIALCFDCSVH